LKFSPFFFEKKEKKKEKKTHALFSLPLSLSSPPKSSKTFPDQLRNRAFKLLASFYFEAAFLRLWRPVMEKHKIPLPGSDDSVPRELGHVFNASPLLEWPRSLPEHVKLVGPILMDFSTTKEEGEVEEKVEEKKKEKKLLTSSSPSPPSSSLNNNGRKDERAPLPAKVEALARAAATGLIDPLVFVSFGTTVRLTAGDARAVAAALRSLAPRKVVWKLSDGDLGGGLTPEELLAEVQGDDKGEENIVAVPWLPQQSLLSRRRVLPPSPSPFSKVSSPNAPPSSKSSSSSPSKPSLLPAVAAFVTHGGMNGLYESAAAGVAVVGVPFFGDGEDNLEKAAGRGIGVTLGRGGLRERRKKKKEIGKWWRSETNATSLSSSSSSSSSSFSSSSSSSLSPSSSNLNASDPTTGAGRLALALAEVLNNPGYTERASRMAKGLKARVASAGRLPREEAADAVELGAWRWWFEREVEGRQREAAALLRSSSSPEEETCAATATE